MKRPAPRCQPGSCGTGLNPRQPVAERRFPPEAADRDVAQDCPQPAAALVIGQAPQGTPGPASRLEGSLNQILGQRAIPAGQEAGVPEQLAAVSGEQAASSSASPGEIFSSPTQASVRELAATAIRPARSRGAERPGQDTRLSRPLRPAGAAPAKPRPQPEGCTAQPTRVTGLSRTAAAKPLPGSGDPASPGNGIDMGCGGPCFSSLKKDERHGENHRLRPPGTAADAVPAAG